MVIPVIRGKSARLRLLATMNPYHHSLMTSAKRQEPVLIDLSLPMNDQLAVWPGDPLFSSRTVANHELDGYHVEAVALGSHTGTHLDAPFHAFTDGEKLDELPLDYFYGPAAVLDLTSVLAMETGSESGAGIEAVFPLLKPEHFTPFEDILANIPRILLKTGWSAHVGKSDYYNAFPSLSPDAMEYLAGFPLMLLGMETPSLFSDLNEQLPLDQLETDHQGHRLFLGRIPPVLLLESLASLDRLPAYTPGDSAAFESSDETRPDSSPGTPADCLYQSDDPRIFTLSCFPLSVTGADAGPVRALAILFPEQSK